MRQDPHVRHVRRWGPIAVVGVGVIAVVLWQVYDPVRAQWQRRTSLPSCGSVVLEQGESLRRDASAELACLREAIESGSGAELKVRQPTVEGDPIWTYYRVMPSGTTEAYEDGTEDQFGTGEWSFSECVDPSSVLDINC